METCVALSTAAGKAGIAVIRLSGDEAIEIASHVFYPMSARALETYPARMAVYGTMLAGDGKKIDTGLATVFRTPHSYTGEDTVELSCHGSPVGVSLILGALLEAGARPAMPGEFTKRAFINGKLDLTQAEAVGDLLDAESADELRLFSAQLEGALGEKLRAAGETIKELLAAVYAYIDYPDEDMSEIADEEMIVRIRSILEELKALCTTYASGRAVTNGIQTAIVGSPNTGKSTFFNLLAGEERAIVTDIAGTTRDVITEGVVCAGVKLRLADTAGMRKTEDTVEKIGVERSEKMLADSELVVAVFDASHAPKEEDEAFVERLSALEKNADKNIIVLLNKCDVADDETVEIWKKRMEQAGLFFICFSAARAEGKEAFEKRIRVLYPVSGEALASGLILANARQYAAVAKAVQCLENALAAMQTLTRDMAGLDLEGALGALCEADGREVSEQVVNTVFSHFCVGK